MRYFAFAISSKSKSYVKLVTNQIEENSDLHINNTDITTTIKNVCVLYAFILIRNTLLKWICTFVLILSAFYDSR